MVERELLGRCLNIHGHPYRVCWWMEGGHLLVSFHDFRHRSADHWKPHGQQIAVYRASTLLEDAIPLEEQGLNLDGGVPEWTVGPSGMTAVLHQLRALQLELMMALDQAVEKKTRKFDDHRLQTLGPCQVIGPGSRELP